MTAGGPDILIVEDSAEIREAMAILLGMEGFRVREAGDGAEALELALGDGPRPDVIVLDMIMPKLSGWEFLRELHERGPASWRSVPVVALTATRDRMDRVPEDWLVASLPKPLEIELLVKTLRELLPAAASPQTS